MNGQLSPFFLFLFSLFLFFFAFCSYLSRRPTRSSVQLFSSTDHWLESHYLMAEWAEFGVCCKPPYLCCHSFFISSHYYCYYISWTIHYISPHCAMTTSWFGLSLVVRVFSIMRTMSMPSRTWPKTTCLLFRNGVAVVVMKNWQPLVFGPEFYVKRKRGRRS